MRHRKKGRKLGRSTPHRMAVRRNMAASLLRHERIITTPARAKEVRPFVERLITLARRALPYKEAQDPKDRAQYLHYYRMVMQRLQDKEMTQKLFGEGEWLGQESLAERYAERPGGYTRLIKLGGSRMGIPIGDTVGSVPELIYEMNGRERSLRLTGNRLGDNAEQVIFELVEKAEAEKEEEEVAPAVSVSEQTASEAAEQPEETGATEETAETETGEAEAAGAETGPESE